MYSQQDLDAAARSARRALMTMLIVALAPLGVIIASLVIRAEWLTIVASCLLFGWLVFAWDLLVSPARGYRRLIALALSGKGRETAGLFKGWQGDEAVTREALRFYPFLLTVGDPEDGKDDRLFYWDAARPRPAWRPLQALSVKSYDRLLVSYTEG